jgi:hypothetical protein
MTSSIAFAAATALVLTSAAANAGAVQPIEAANLDLGAVSGIAYYTPEPDGFHVFATLFGAGESPMRVEVVLAPGARVVLSSAGKLGTAPLAVAIVRRQDGLFIEPAVASLD